MAVTTSSFDWNGARITVQQPNGFSRIKIWRYQQALKDLDGIEWTDHALLCYYLACTVKIEGSIGFLAVVEDPTPSEVLAFCRGLGESSEQLLLRWDETIKAAVMASNDPDLLPPDELSQKKEKTPEFS